MPAIIAGAVDTDALEPGMVYSDESGWITAVDELTAGASDWTDVPGLTITLNLARPAGVVQIAQVDFSLGAQWQTFELRLVCDGQVSTSMRRSIRYANYWQNVIIFWFWPGLSPGSHTLKVQYKSPTGAIKYRKNAVIVMRV